MTKVAPDIFKAYDVRGIYPDQIDDEVAYRVGRAFARVLRDLRGGRAARQLRVVIGHDMRLHSPALAEAFTRGLVDEGAHVLDIGMVGTEMVYYAVGSRELDGGVSVTASHNPEAVGRVQAACARGRCRCPATRASRTCSGSRRPGISPSRPGRARSSELTSTSRSGSTCSDSSTRRRSARCMWCSTAATGWPGR